MNQLGIYSEFEYIRDPVNFTLGFGAIKRYDTPDGFIDPFWTEEAAGTWAFPIRCTIGLTLMTKPARKR